MPGSAAAGTVAPQADGVVDDVAIDGRLASRVGLSRPGGRFKSSATAAVADSGYSKSISQAAWRAGDEAMSQGYPSAAFSAGSRLVPRLAHSRSMARGVRAQRCRQRPCLVCQGGAALPRYETRPKMPAVDRRWRAAEQIHCGPGLSPAPVHACRAAGALVLHRGRKTVAIPRARGAAAPAKLVDRLFNQRPVRRDALALASIVRIQFA